MPRVSVYLDEDIDSGIFATKVIPVIEIEIENPNTQLIFPAKPAILWRYLVTRKFTNGLVYVVTDRDFKIPFPRIITPGASFILNNECDILIKYDKISDRMTRLIKTVI